jgi:hypothetical protein
MAQEVVSQNIDTVNLCIIIQFGILDSFGEFHPDGETTLMQDPKWLTMSQKDFEEAAMMGIEMSNNF